MEVLSSGIVDTLLVWEKLDLVRHEIRNKISGDKKISYCKEEESPFEENEENEVFEIENSIPLIDYLVDNFKSFGAKLEIIQDYSGESSQFCKGFGGLGAILRYKHEFQDGDELEDELEDDLAEYFEDGKEEIEDSF